MDPTDKSFTNAWNNDRKAFARGLLFVEEAVLEMRLRRWYAENPKDADGSTERVGVRSRERPCDKGRDI